MKVPFYLNLDNILYLITKVPWLIALHNFSFTLFQVIAAHCNCNCCMLCKTPFSVNLHMCTCSLIPKLPNTASGLGTDYLCKHAVSRVDDLYQPSGWDACFKATLLTLQRWGAANCNTTHSLTYSYLIHYKASVTRLCCLYAVNRMKVCGCEAT